MNDKHFRAFISYSQQDRVWGKRLHTWLETYRIPVGVVADVRLPERLGRFFRDDEDMPAAADIAETVRDVIKAAESLIVICSPRSAQSKWVNSEIQHFRRTGRERKVFAVIIDGVPNSGDPATECFPPALRAVGDPDDPDAMPIEPMGLDVRVDPRDRLCARLAAGLLDVDFDDLWRRDRRRRTRTRIIAASGAGAVALALGVVSVLALLSSQEAERARALAVDFFIDRAGAAEQEGEFERAARYALAGRRLARPDRREEFDFALLLAMQAAGEDPGVDGEDLWEQDVSEGLLPDAGRSRILAHACNVFLKDGFRWFSAAEIEEDKLLTLYWPEAERDVCEGAPGVREMSLPQWLASLREPLGGEGELFLCPGVEVANAPRTGRDRQVIGYSPRIAVNGVALAVNPAPYACLAAGFGRRNGRLHKGVDFADTGGGPIFSAGAGVVREAGYRDDYGNYLLIDHGGGVHTRYAHLARFEPGIAAGRPVAADTPIGTMGQTAAFTVPVQLHYEILFGDYDTPARSFGLHPVPPL